MEDSKLKVCIIFAEQIDLDTVHVNELSDEEFLELATERHVVLTLPAFVDSFNKDSISISSANCYIRII